MLGEVVDSGWSITSHEISQRRCSACRIASDEPSVDGMTMLLACLFGGLWISFGQVLILQASAHKRHWQPARAMSPFSCLQQAFRAH